MRPIKCRWCNEMGAKSSMKVDLKISESGRTTNIYVHDQCYAAYSENKLYLMKETDAKLRLHKLVADIYEVDYKEFPKSFFVFLEQVRNGNDRPKGGRYKEGISYELLAQVYEYCREEIKRVRTYKTFVSPKDELFYGLAIVRNNVFDVKRLNEQQRINDSRHEIVERKIESNVEHREQEIEYKPTGKKASNDISDFL